MEVPVKIDHKYEQNVVIDNSSSSAAATTTSQPNEKAIQEERMRL